MECKYCGHPINEYDKTCPGCDGPNDSFGERKAETPATTHTVHYAQAPKKTFKGSWGVFVLLFILCWPVALIYLVVKSFF